MIESAENMPSAQTNKLSSQLLPILLAVAGACIVVWGSLSIVKAKESVNWPTAEGIVVNSSVEDSKHSNETTKKSVYHANVVYEFIVNGTEYSSNRVAFGDYGSGKISHADEIVSRYPVGMDVLVYYRSDKPKVCLLEPGLKLQSFYVLGFGLVFLITGVLFFFFLPGIEAKQRIAKQLEEQKESGESV